ncbi:hypothetical protein ANO11243_073070 [Dothideomycetidae sp. 11243]|nr:hypothetical protein ANO11243_073070 [fungal sp. No.11243]
MGSNSSSLAIGELVGAAGFITAVVAGSMALVRPFKVARKSFVRDVGFFAVAVAFSMGFLSDGHLHLWECIGMVIYYIFYVVVVVLWHWVITKAARRRERDAAARGHYSVAGGEEVDVQEEYRDEPDDESGIPHSRGVSVEDFRALEGGIPRIQVLDEDNDDENLEALGEITTNMRLKRTGRHRRNTITPVRPSLVGALEFQAVLKSLNRSRNMQTIPMHARRYSDEPTYTMAQHEELDLATSTPALASSSNEPGSSNLLMPQTGGSSVASKLTVGGRTRAVSANDAASLQLDPKFFQKHAASHTPGLEQSSTSPTFLQLPPNDVFMMSDRRRRLISEEGARDSPDQSPKSRPTLSILKTPKSGTRSPRSGSPISPFPTYHDGLPSSSGRLPSIFLPPPASASVESQHFHLGEDQDLEEVQPPKWWPSRLLPSPAELFLTLTPTLCHWKEKSWWEILLGLVAAPSVFLLTVTLPVVDCDRDDEDDSSIAAQDEHAPPTMSSPQLQLTTPEEDHAGLRSPKIAGTAVANVATKAEQHRHNGGRSEGVDGMTNGQGPASHDLTSDSKPKLWNRWLTIVQLYLAPTMIVLIIYIQYFPSETASFRQTITRPLLIALLVSTILLVPLLLTTTTTHRPRFYLPLLSLAGFIVSIAWISTIASQVVAVLKTFAIILNMSHAILGLTVFAVGNSLGDLVADITVARLGFPVMALSACFGGPMLNILLGIGLSGSYILIRGASSRHKKHPDSPWHSGTYEIEVGDTLIVSGVTLLVTLVGLLVAVPLSGWMMTRRIAWALMALWCVSTVVNVVLEVTGLGASDGE